MNEKDLNIDGLDRGDETLEQLEARLPQAAIDLANENSERVVILAKKKERKFNHRNRNAWNRMNRTSRLKGIEENMERTLNFCNFKGYVLDKDLPKETEEDELRIILEEDTKLDPST